MSKSTWTTIRKPALFSGVLSGRVYFVRAFRVSPEGACEAVGRRDDVTEAMRDFIRMNPDWVRRELALIEAETKP